MNIRLAVAQPRLIREPDPQANVAQAVELIARAAAAGAQLVLFPEGAPGPHRPGISYEAGPAMAQAAADQGLAVCWSRMEHCVDGFWRLVVYVHDASGQQVVRYERSHPATLPPDQTGAWVAPGDGLCSFELDGVPIGIAVCSELWVPEPARVLALRGAQVILSPAGGGFTTLTENWQLIARARAIENLCYVALTNNIFASRETRAGASAEPRPNDCASEVGAAMIAGPERVLIASGTEDLLVATCDLERVRWLRGRDDSLEEPKPFSSIPGLLRARRPELYGELAERSGDLYDYTTPPVATPS
jgi:5-aminopentanamidase